MASLDASVTTTEPLSKATVLWWIGGGIAISVTTAFVLIQVFYGISNARIDQISTQSTRSETHLKESVRELKIEQRDLKVDIQKSIGDLKVDIKDDITLLRQQLNQAEERRRFRGLHPDRRPPQ